MPRNIDLIVSDFLEDMRVDNNPPLDVFLLARRMGVDTFTEADMMEDGRLDHDYGRIVISVRPGLSLGRKRFTIAHELAHLLLMNPASSATTYRSITARGDEERFCDEIAAALLLPNTWIRHRYENRLKNLSTLRHLAHDTQTSLSASVVRLNELHGWRCSLLRWRQYTGGWRLAGMAGMPQSRNSLVQSAADTDAALSQIARRGTRDQLVSIPLLIDGCHLKVSGQVSVTGSSAIALIENANL